MGRRSTNSTKAGKFMNPTDQARKEARKKELKKNKLQRLKVRQEVIKQKDPKQIFNELEAIDKIEYDINNPPQLNVKVLQEKRRKLKDSWLKMFQFYQKEDPKTASELKALELDYERRRHQLATIYESVMQAQKVKLDEIPLPSMTLPPPPPPPTSSSEVSSAPKSILKSKSETALKNLNKEPPGPPSGQPPDLSEFDADEFDIDLQEEATNKSQQSKKIRFDSEEIRPARAATPPPPSLIAPTIPSTIPIQVAASFQSRPTLMQPPPPPPVPQMASISQAAQYQQISKSIQQQIANSRLTQQQSAQNYYQQQSKTNESVQAAAAPTQSNQLTIQAKPVIRNKMAEITRFVPTSLVVKRTEGSGGSSGAGTGVKKQPTHIQSNITSQQTGSAQGPYNYMLQHQQQYATLNPLTTYRSTSSSSLNLQNHQYEPTPVTNIQPIINSTTPTAKRIDPTDAAYATFMKEIGKLL